VYQAHGLFDLVAHDHLGRHPFRGMLEDLEAVEGIEASGGGSGLADAHAAGTIAPARTDGALHYPVPPVARVDDLPPDQRAVCSLILRQGRTYDELAGTLRMESDAVRERAHLALRALGPRDGIPPEPERQADIADFLLGQQPASRRAGTRSYLERSGPGRAWARVVADELRSLAPDGVPEIPAEARGNVAAVATRTDEAAQTDAEPDQKAEESTDPSPRGEGSPRSSRRGGALLLLALAAVVAVIVVLIVTSAGGSKSASTGPGGSAVAPSTTSATPPPAASAPTSTTPNIVAQVNLSPPHGGGPTAGVVNILAASGQLAMAIRGQSLPASKGGYAVWLYNSQSDAQRLGFTQAVGSDGRLAAEATLPASAPRFHRLILTRETSASPTQPGTIVLSGPLNLSGR